MAPALANGVANAASRRTFTTTGLRRWSVQNKPIPDVSQIKALHIYDFDNTLFSSPLPNQQLWYGPTIGLLQTPDCFAAGGWWHDPGVLSATGGGIEVEEPRAWKGWWNEQVVQLVELSMEQKDVCTVLLTGRSEGAFCELIKRMVAAKKLEFDLICLKPEAGPNNQRFPTTASFKQGFLEALLHTYKNAESVRVYEDRIKHVRGFRDYFESFNSSLHALPQPSRRPINPEVIHVVELSQTLDAVIETAQIQRMINAHNLAVKAGTARNLPFGRQTIKRTISYTGYLISPRDSTRLTSLIVSPLNITDFTDIRPLASNILITPRPAPRSVLDKVGGLGKKLTWRVTGVGVSGNRIWAARVAPFPETEQYFTENAVPHVVLGHRKSARSADAARIQNWQPVPTDKQFVFETVVGEKLMLRVEEEYAGETEWESLFPNNARGNKRRHANDDFENQGPYQNHGRDNHRERETDRNPREDKVRVTRDGPVPGHHQNQAQGQNNYSNQPRRFDDRDDRRGSSYRGGNQSRGRGGNQQGTSNRGALYSGRNDGPAGRGGRGNDRRGGGGGGGGGGGRDRRRGGGAGGGTGYKSLDDAGGDTRGFGMDGSGEAGALNY